MAVASDGKQNAVIMGRRASKCTKRQKKTTQRMKHMRQRRGGRDVFLSLLLVA